MEALDQPKALREVRKRDVTTQTPGRSGQVDPGPALATPLAGLDGRVTTLGHRVGQGPSLVLIVERDCPTSRGALRALAGAVDRLTVISQGRPEAARELSEETDTGSLDVLVEPAPHPVPAGLAADTVPTFVLLDGGDVVGHLEG